MSSDILEPINLGGDRLVTINRLIDIVEDIAGVKFEAALQARRAERRARPLQRELADQEKLWAPSISLRRDGEDLPLDPR